MAKHIESSQIIPCQMPTNKSFQNLNGLRFGRLIVKEFAGKRIGKRGEAYYLWNCLCDCGEKSIVYAGSLNSGNTKSCGCLRGELSSTRQTIHGLSQTPEYEVWSNMKRRCQEESNKAWKDYGGRGITVCDRWMDFTLFYSDIGPRPTPKHTLGRINNGAGYSPSNCRWETKTAQNNNTRSNRFLTFGGKTMTVSEWGRHVGVSSGLIFCRLRLGWSDERAVLTPVKVIKRKGHNLKSG